ncbi:MAG: hypothetical protein ACTSQG_00135 [Promethearchaeota archaeon]
MIKYLEVPDIIKKLISTFLSDNKIIEEKIFFEFKNDLFIISFSIANKTASNSKELNGISDESIIFEIEDFIKKNLYKNSIMEIVINYNNNSSYKILVFLSKIKKMMINSNSLKKCVQEKIKNERENENKKEIEKINKTLKQIENYPDGINHKDLIQKTRFFKTTKERENVLELLKNNNKISINVSCTYKKPKRIYKALYEVNRI